MLKNERLYHPSVTRFRQMYLGKMKQLLITFKPLPAPFATKKALLIGMVLVTLNQFSGCFALINYTAHIFAEAGSNLDPNVSAMVVGAIQLAGSYVSTMVVDRCKRKVLYIVSSFGSAIGLGMMGVHAYLAVSGFDVSKISWLPVASLSFVIFIASVGILPLTFVILSEILPQKVRKHLFWQ